MQSFSQFTEAQDSEDRIKQAILSQLGINPDHIESRMDDEIQSFANSHELEKMPILDELPPDVKGSTIAALKDGNTKLRDLINIISRQSDLGGAPSSSDVDKMEPSPSTTQWAGNDSAPSDPL